MRHFACGGGAGIPGTRHFACGGGDGSPGTRHFARHVHRQDPERSGQRWRTVAAPNDVAGRNMELPKVLRKVSFCPRHWRNWLPNALQTLETRVILAHLSHGAKPIMNTAEDLPTLNRVLNDSGDCPTAAPSERRLDRAAFPAESLPVLRTPTDVNATPNASIYNALRVPGSTRHQPQAQPRLAHSALQPPSTAERGRRHTALFHAFLLFPVCLFEPTNNSVGVRQVRAALGLELAEPRRLF